MTSLAQYVRARAALAEATRIDEILPLRDECEHLKLYARQISDRKLLADAHSFQMQVERKLGQVLIAAKDAGQIGAGRPPKNGQTEFPRVSLSEVGISKNLSSRSQLLASMDEANFKRRLEERVADVQIGKPKTIRFTGSKHSDVGSTKSHNFKLIDGRRIGDLRIGSINDRISILAKEIALLELVLNHASADALSSVRQIVSERHLHRYLEAALGHRA